MVDGAGGAIDNDGTLTIDNCTFNNNNATAYGGAICTSNNLKVTNSIFKCNKAGKEGGAIAVDPRVVNKGIIFVDNSNIFIDNLPNDSNIPLNNTLNYRITLTNTGKSTITIKYYISIYTNSVNGEKVGYKEVTITLKPKETKRIYLGKYPAGHIVSGTMIVKNPSKKRIQLNLQVKYEIEGFDPEIRKISNYIAPRKEFKYSVKYRVNEYGSIEVS
nr:hypothetical protein [Methanothermus fervidus]